MDPLPTTRTIKLATPDTRLVRGSRSGAAQPYSTPTFPAICMFFLPSLHRTIGLRNLATSGDPSSLRHAGSARTSGLVGVAGLFMNFIISISLMDQRQRPHLQAHLQAPIRIGRASIPSIPSIPSVPSTACRSLSTPNTQHPTLGYTVSIWTDFQSVHRHAVILIFPNFFHCSPCVALSWNTPRREKRCRR